MKKVLSMLLFLSLLLGAMAGLADGAEAPDAVSGASENHYEDVSLDREALLAAMQRYLACSFATVNEDGSPNLAVFVPGVAGDNHLVLGLAPNASRDNILRTKQAMVSLFVLDPDASERADKYSGARLKVTLEEDEAVVQELRDSNERYTENHMFLRIEEILPIG